MSHPFASALLKQKGLKDTATRRMVVEALASAKAPLAPLDIQQMLQKEGQPIGIVTVYRVIEALEAADLVHRHPLEGSLSLCLLPDQPGHHVLLHCVSCGKVEETHDEALCLQEEALAEKFGFSNAKHVSELAGTCSTCT